MTYTFSRRDIYNRFVKKENVYDRLKFLTKVRGVLVFSVAIAFLVISFTVVPNMLNLFISLRVEPPFLAKYSLHIFIFISSVMAVFAIQTMFTPLSRSHIKEKLSKYRDGDLVNISEFKNHRFNFIFSSLCIILFGLLFTGIIFPLYHLILEMGSSNIDNVVSQKEIETEWILHKIEKSSFSLKYSPKAEMTDENGCITIKYGLAYLAILNPQRNNQACLNQKSLEDANPLSEEELVIDETQYSFKGYLFNGRENSDKKNTELFRNTGGIFGNGVIVEYGGNFLLTEIEKYQLDKAILTNVLETAYRNE